MTVKDMHVAPPSHVLLVGSDEAESRCLITGLQDVGMRLSQALGGMQGYERAQAAQPDIILAEQEMPGMDGLNMLRLLKTNPLTREIPILLISGESSAGQRLNGFREGAADVIAKPFLVEEVVAKVSVHLGWLARLKQAQEICVTLGNSDEQNTLTDQEVLVRAVQKHILDNLAVSSSVAELAQRFSVSERRLASAFKACLNMSVFAYTRQERMRKAQYLLANTALSMEIIAAEVGFSSAANFSTAFHSYCGATPTAYRSAAHERAWRERGAALSKL